MTPCERNCFCRCDGSCRGAAPVRRAGVEFVREYGPGWELATCPAGIVAAHPNHPPELNGKPIKPLFPDNVPDFTQEACAQGRVKIP